MKKTNLKQFALLLAAILLPGSVWAGGTTDEYNAALAVLENGATYTISTVYNEVTYYLTTSGTLTATEAEAGQFLFQKKENAASMFPTGWNMSSGDMKGFKSYVWSDRTLYIATNTTATSITDDICQVLFLNENGKYAMRCTNVNKANEYANGKWDGVNNAYWYVFDPTGGSSVPTAGYGTTSSTIGYASYVWTLTKVAEAIVVPDFTIVATKVYKVKDTSDNSFLSSGNKFAIIECSSSNGTYFIYDITIGQFVTISDGNISEQAAPTPIAVASASSAENYATLVGTYGDVFTLGDNTTVWAFIEQEDETYTLDITNGSDSNSFIWKVTDGLHIQNFSYTATINAFGTLMIPFDATLPDGMKAYNLTGVTDGYIQGEEVENITRNKPVLVKGSGSFTLTTTSGGTYKGNGAANGLLTGTYGQYNHSASSASNWVLQKLNDVVAFYQVDTAKPITIPAFHAFLTYTPEAGVKQLSISFDVATSINAANIQVEGLSDIFNLSGVRQATLTRGVNIVRKSDGSVRKLIVK